MRRELKIEIYAMFVCGTVCVCHCVCVCVCLSVVRIFAIFIAYSVSLEPGLIGLSLGRRLQNAKAGKEERKSIGNANGKMRFDWD